MAYIDTKYIGECEFCRHHRSGKCDTWCDYGECYQPDMSKIPTADVIEVKHGYWKDNHNGTFTCSECEGKSSKMDWCGRCGAKMDRK